MKLKNFVVIILAFVLIALARLAYADNPSAMFVRKTGDRMTGTLQLPKLKFNDGTSQTTAAVGTSVPSCALHQKLNGVSGVLTCRDDFDPVSDATRLIATGGRNVAADGFIAGSNGITFADSTVQTTAASAAGGPWHFVGTTGEPAYGGTWTGFNGTTQANLAYRVVGDVLYIRGWAKDGAVPTNPTPSFVFTLPVAARPAHDNTFLAIATGISHPAQPCMAEVLQNGTVELLDCNTTAWVDFQGVIPLTL